MPIYPETEKQFNCAICHREAPRRWEFPDMKSRAPLCFGCEQTWGKGPAGKKKPDERLIRQIGALAAALECTAHCYKVGCKAPYG